MQRKEDEQMIYTVQVALACAAATSTVVIAALLFYRKRFSKPAELRATGRGFERRGDARQ
jgi:hypothetical protein